MQIALECPTELLDEIQPLADFDFALTHLVLTDAEYARWYRDSLRFCILDNSTNELLKPCSLEDIGKAADIIGPNLIVAPDFLDDYVATIDSIREAVSMFGPEKVLPVVQGKTFEDSMKCADYIIEAGFRRLAIPYDANCSREEPTEVMANSRLLLTNRIINKVPMAFQIHLLGITTLEELSLHNVGWVTSIDTGVPIMMGGQLKDLGKEGLKYKRKPTLDLMDSDVGWKQLSYIYKNIGILRRVCNGSR